MISDWTLKLDGGLVKNIMVLLETKINGQTKNFRTCYKISHTLVYCFCFQIIFWLSGLLLSSECHVIVLCLFLMVPWVGL